MEVTYTRIDMELCRTNRHTPQDVIPRLPQDVWVVSHDAIQYDSPVRWVFHKTESHVLIPLVPYLLHAEPDLALAFAFSLGIRCAFQLNTPVKRLHIACGVPVDTLPENPPTQGLRYHLGFGLVLDT